MSLKAKIKSAYKYLSPKYQSIQLNYRVDPKQRYHIEKPHQLLYDIIEKNQESYEQLLHSFNSYTTIFQNIKLQKHEVNQDAPVWNNGYLPGLDMVSIYGIIARYKPNHYIEIGSGNSTKIARKAIIDHTLSTRITSIDPVPRANIDKISDKVIRKPLEALGNIQYIIDELNENDILFIDNSHFVFPNSDAMICFMEILPYLKKGVIVHVHDIFLPYDYPIEMCQRFYNEQYMLAAFIMSNPQRYKIILPNYFICQHPKLFSILNPIWQNAQLADVEKHGGSFWIQINE